MRIEHYTLVVCSYQRPRGLKRLLESIDRMQKPAGPSFDVLVVDDGSDYDVSVWIRSLSLSFPLEVRVNPHSGISHSRNTGIRLARGNFVCFLADDYELPTDFLVKVQAFFRRCPGESVVSWNVHTAGKGWPVDCQNLYISLALLGNAQDKADDFGVIRSFALPASRAATFRKEVFDKVGLFDEKLLEGEDGEMGLRLTRHHIPVCFMSHDFIEHHEKKRLIDFLRQRIRYATSSHKVLFSGKNAATVPATRTVRWFFRVLEIRMAEWKALAEIHGLQKNFQRLRFGLRLYLAFFYGTLYRLGRANRSSVSS